MNSTAVHALRQIPPFLRALCRNAALLLIPLGATAADWRHVETSPQERIVPRYYRIGADYALWSVSDDGVRRSAAGATQLLYRSASSSRLPEDGVRELVPLADGGALLDHSGIRNVRGYCAATRIAADGRVQWQITVPFADEICRGIFANAAGQSWLFSTEKLYPVDAAGRVGPQVAVVGQPYWTRPAAVLADGSIATATRLRGVSTSRMARFDAQGRELWNWVRQDQKPLAFVTAAADGIAAVAIDEIGTAANEMLRWNGAGQLLWTHALPAQTSITDVVAADGGDLYVVLSSGSYSAKTLRRIGADGSLRWDATLDCKMYSQTGQQAISRTAGDGLALVCDNGIEPAVLLRVNRSGAVSSLPLPLHTPQQVVQQGDGRLLVLGLRQSAEAPPARHTLIVDGNAVAEAALDNHRDDAASYLVGQQFLADGSSFIATAPELVQSNTTSLTLTRLAPDGRVVWTRRSNDPAYRGRNALAVGGGLVCVALDSAVTFTNNGGQGMDGLLCVDADSGATRWYGIYSQDGLYGFGALSIDATGAVRSVRSRLNFHELQRFDRNGNIESIVRGDGIALRAAFDAHGAATLATRNALRRYAQDGTPAWTVPAASAPVSLFSAQYSLLWPGDDGSVWISGEPANGGANRRLWAVAPDGRTRWTRELDSISYNQLLIRGDVLYGVGTRRDSSGSDRSLEFALERMDAASGTVSWSYRSRQTAFEPGQNMPAISPDGRHLLLTYSQLDRLRLQRVRSADGVLVQENLLACERLCGVASAAALDDSGSGRVALAVLDREKGQSTAVVATDLTGTTTRLDQHGITGAWWSPYAHGEGIAFEWLPDSRTLFGAWFTYSAAGGNDPAELRWYTLQANGVAAGARTLELPILESGGGNFNAAPAVAPRVVGNAKIEFQDCTKGSLRYAFDAGINDGRSGLITLSRLSPATQPCILADGSSQPAAGARPPSKGFDARQSGNWYDPATGGQGLQFTVQPDGVFFAPWFTFDPADAGNDAGRQHWFTLQGDLSTALNGRVQLQLVQTIGGAFDRVPTYNTNAVGTATLRLLTCDRAELDYRFGDDAGAGPFRTRSGTLRLQRAGGCTP